MTPYYEAWLWYDEYDDLPKRAHNGDAFYVGYLRSCSMVMWHKGRFCTVVDAAAL